MAAGGERTIRSVKQYEIIVYKEKQQQRINITRTMIQHE